ncbi:uncharacterized protein LOC121406240 [Lytechinus variegatus]|uniref:uncharacterized protein LOC121406240 n=1 Tax=Lytechinus variegatus TaxID=7654 RepID=UPI001BB10A51|nr:uncharacterized protein LOC121406240 [Lytechinus variegatus]
MITTAAQTTTKETTADVPTSSVTTSTEYTTGMTGKAEYSSTQAENDTSHSSTQQVCHPNPCNNGGSCLETPEGFQCDCPTEFYNSTCSCQVIYTEDTQFHLDNINHTIPDIHIPQGVMSFAFEVSADSNAFIGLSGYADHHHVYEIGIGMWDNTGGAIRLCDWSHWEPTCSSKARRDNDPAAMALSGIPAYDRFEISFANGHIQLFREGHSGPLMQWHHSGPLDVYFIYVFSVNGSRGYWKFPLMC